MKNNKQKQQTNKKGGPGARTLKGFRDFLPSEKRRRDFVTQKFIETFEKFGFAPLETPTLEYASLLLGKYGEEADRLVYTFEDKGDRKVGLRYDQTVPTARVLAQYQNELPKYFRRYQVQNVFRADKPQKGRYREFTQCDLDIFGSTSPLADAEIMACTYEGFKNIGFEKIELRFNDRETLISTLQPFATDSVNVFSIIQSVDKLDKQTPEQVAKELVSKGLAEKAAEEVLTNINKAEKSINLKQIEQNLLALGVPQKSIVFTPTLARGLDYYTGMIFEVILPEYGVGSCGGGGRYDNLIESLGGPNVPAVGIGIGFDRAVEAAVQLGLIPNQDISAQVLVTIFDENTLKSSLKTASQLREAGIKVELYPAIDKLGKQLKYASKIDSPWVIVIGEEEMKQNAVSLKNMASGEQETLALEEVIDKLLQ